MCSPPFESSSVTTDLGWLHFWVLKCKALKAKFSHRVSTFQKKKKREKKKKPNAFKGIIKAAYYNNKNTKVTSESGSNFLCPCGLLKSSKYSSTEMLVNISILLLFTHWRQAPWRNQPAECMFVKDQIQGPRVLAGFHCPLQKLEIQQLPSIHFFLTLWSVVSFLSLKSDCWNRSNC